MAAATYDIEIEQGTTFECPLVWSDDSDAPYDLTGFSARMQVRASKSASEVLLSFTTANSKIVLGTTDGKITLKLTASETAAIGWTEGVYDLEVESSGGRVTRLIQGKVTVDPEVTR